MTVSTLTVPKAKAVLILDDIREVADSISVYLESIHVRNWMATTVADAVAILEKHGSEIGTAFIDKVLDRAPGLAQDGIQFILQHRPQYTDVKFVLITAWPMSAAETQLLRENGIDAMDKLDMVDKYLQYEQSEPRVGARPAQDGQDAVPGEMKDQILAWRLGREAFRRKYEELSSAWQGIAEDLVRRLEQFDSGSGEGILLGSRSYTMDELILEVRNPSSRVGRQLVELHSRVMDDLVKDR